MTILRRYYCVCSLRTDIVAIVYVIRSAAGAYIKLSVFDFFAFKYRFNSFKEKCRIKIAPLTHVHIVYRECPTSVLWFTDRDTSRGVLTTMCWNILFFQIYFNTDGLEKSTK